MSNMTRASLIKSKVASLGIPKSYQRLGGFPLDDSTVFGSIADRNAMVEGVRYAGMITYVEDTQELYILKGGLDNDCWVPVSTTETKKIISYPCGGTPIVTGQVLSLTEDLKVIPAMAKAVIGVALNSGNEGEQISVQLVDEVKVSCKKDLVVGKNCFLGKDADVVQSLEGCPVLLQLGVATGVDTVMLSIDNDMVVLEEN